MVSWKVFRESAVEIVGEDLVGLIEKSFKKGGKEIDPSKVADILHKHEKIDESEKDLLNEAYKLLLEEEEARTIQEDSKESEDAMTFADNEEIFEQEKPDLPKLKKFTLVDIIGQGGMGRVYKGVDPDLGRPVAVKEILGKAKDYQKQRFQREILLTAKLDQEHRVIRARAVDQDSTGNTYFVMDFVEGKELTDYVENLGRGRTYSLENAIELLAEAIDAISIAHKQGIIHRDIKPDNIMADRRNVKIMDWGLAKEIDDEEIESAEEDITGTDISRSATFPNLTQDGTAMGTPRYMSPEQAINAKYADERSDIYSFGAILYEMLTGQSPNVTNIKKKKKESIDVKKILVNLVDFDKPAVSPSKISRNVPPELESICMKALEKDPEERYQTAEEFRDDLRAYSRGGNVSAHKYSMLSKLSRFIQRHTAAAASAFIIITALGAGGIFYQTQQAATARAEAKAERLEKEQAREEAREAEEEARKIKEKARKEKLEQIAKEYAYKGKTFAEADRYEEAVQAYTASINNDPNYIDAIAGRGYAYYYLAISEQNPAKQTEYFQRAKKDLKKASNIEQRDIDLYRLHATVEIALGNEENAKKIYETAYSIDNQNLDLLADIATFYVEKDWKKVKDTCLEMLDINPDFIQAHVGLFSAYRKLGQLELSEEHARYLVNTRQIPNAWIFLGRILIDQAIKSKDSDEKETCLEEAIQVLSTGEKVCQQELLPQARKYLREAEIRYNRIKEK